MRKELVARIDPEKAYAYFRNTQGWSREQVDQQVLTPLDDASIMGTPADQDSIMCYQLPGEITVDGEPIHGGLDINATDRDFAAQIYPKNGALGPSSGVTQDDWDPGQGRGSLLVTDGRQLRTGGTGGQARLCRLIDLTRLEHEPEPVEVLARSAYGTGRLLDELDRAGHSAVIKPWPLRPAVPDGFTLDDFTVDHLAGTVTCPNGLTRPISPKGKVTFGAGCTGCPLRTRCTSSARVAS